MRHLTVLGLAGNDLRDLPGCFSDLKNLATTGSLKVTDMFDGCSNLRFVVRFRFRVGFSRLGPRVDKFVYFFVLLVHVTC